jgi:hypothetical protein
MSNDPTNYRQAADVMADRLRSTATEAVDDVLDSKPFGLAVLAVLALHKPYGDGYTACQECSHKVMGEPFIITYPCPTVQAIARELPDR